VVSLDELEKADFSCLPVKTRVEAFYKATDQMVRFSKEVIYPVIRGQLGLNDREKAIVGTYLRMHMWMLSLVAMNSCVHLQGVAAAVRSLIELYFDIAILASDKTGILVEKFHEFVEVERFRYGRNLINFNDSHPEITKDDDLIIREYVVQPERQKRVKKTILKLWGTTSKGKIKSPNHWTGKDIIERARSLGPEYEHLYVQAYPRLSWYIHTGSPGYGGIDAVGLESSIAIAHNLAQKMFLKSLIICAKEMKIDCAIEFLYEAINDLGNLPGKIIIEELTKHLEKAKANAP